MVSATRAVLQGPLLLWRCGYLERWLCVRRTRATHTVHGRKYRYTSIRSYMPSYWLADRRSLARSVISGGVCGYGGRKRYPGANQEGFSKSIPTTITSRNRLAYE